MAKQLTDVIGCCICLGIPQAWIYQCENGHSYCDKGHTVQVNGSWTSLVCTSNQEQLKPRLIKEPFVGARFTTTSANSNGGLQDDVGFLPEPQRNRTDHVASARLG